MTINSMAAKAGITRHKAGMDGVHWNILGQVYTPKQITEDCFSWHAMLPVESFIPPHIHPTQDEYILLLDGKLDFWLGDEMLSAETGDLITLPRGIPHGIYNNSGADVQCFFGSPRQAGSSICSASCTICPGPMKWRACPQILK